MIQVQDLRKSYKTGDFVQRALDGVSLSFRDSEFVAILGPSGSGKTTLLNVLGGLDHADSGDIVVNGVSTKDYRSKDWDTYRNHRIGFVFQSYNLIPHQTVLANVELALTLSGVHRAERRRRARAALEQVGLGDHINKRPSQLSGGQMQRVAIARALVNDPDIVLADEPTGALDTETGVQVMDILREVAADRLVIMVTHNPDLAERYATRIVNLSDGRIVGDSNPYEPPAGTDGASAVPETEGAAAIGGKVASPAMRTGYDAPAAAGATAQMTPVAGDGHGRPDARNRADAKGKHASMGFLTALSLSFSNLMTKKGRTFLTAFAGSIGIIGIAAILAISNGVNNYIEKTEQDALSAYPLTISKSSFDMSTLFGGMGDYASGASDAGAQAADDGSQVADLDTTIGENTIMSDMFAQVKNNDLVAFKEFLDGGGNGIWQYVSAIQYDYGITPQIYSTDTSNGPVQVNPSSLGSMLSSGVTNSALSSSTLAGGGITAFNEMMDDRDLLDSQMDVVAGRWPESYDEAVLVLNQDGEVSDFTLYSLGFYDTQAMDDMAREALDGDEVEVPDEHKDFTYQDALDMTFSVVPAANLYQHNDETDTWTDMSGDDAYVADQIAQGIQLKVVGVVRPADTTSASSLAEGIAYTPELIDELRSRAADAQVVQDQLADPDTDVFTGETFESLQESQGDDLDFSSLVSVDEDALANAFSIDTDALESAMGSGFDASVLDVDTDALASAFDSDAMAQMMAGAPQPDFSSISPDLTGSEESQQASSAVVGGFMAYLMTSGVQMTDSDAVAAAWDTYMTTPADQGGGQEAVQQLAGVLGGSYSDAISQAMESYVSDQLSPYIASSMGQMMQQAMAQLSDQLTSAITQQMTSSMSGLPAAMQSAMHVDADAFANAIKFNMTQEDLTSLLTNYLNADELTYDANLKKLGYAADDNPESISIYPTDFDAKESVLSIIDGYNDQMQAEGNDDATISYSDVMGTLMRSVTDIVDKITMVLVAFVSISLVVSSIMIGIITYISVLERKKEIGVLRAMGASKLNVASVFNAETVIEGLISGVMAILVVELVSFPVNAFVEQGWQIANVMSLPIHDAIALICISVALTLVAGLIPSMAAARRDPVEALRSE